MPWAPDLDESPSILLPMVIDLRDEHHIPPRLQPTFGEGVLDED